jgi:hypothetical protein
MIRFGLVILMLRFVNANAQDSLAYKPKEEYEAQINLSFKKRESDSANSFRFESSERKRTMDAPIAYLIVNFKILKAENEVRVRTIRGKDTKTDKIKIGEVMKLEIGFIEDIKSSQEPEELELRFLDKDKKALSRVVFTVSTDGTYLINGEKRGKF